MAFEPVPVLTQSTGVWELLHSSPDSGERGRHEDVYFTNPDVGWIVNTNGEIHQTTDGGESWTLVNALKTPEGEPLGFRSTTWANEKKGWIGSLTDGHFLYETSDGGRTLTDISKRIAVADSFGVCGLWAVNDDVVYGVGRFNGPARVVKTLDGGETWSVKRMDEWAGRLIDVMFFDQNNGLVTGGTDESAYRSHAVVLRTTDGGESWEEVFRSLRFGEWGWKISFPTNLVGFISVERLPYRAPAHILRTDDGGKTWHEITIEDSLPLQGIGFLTPDIGWTSGRGQTFTTSTGGASWQEISLDGGINRFRVLGDTLAFAVGKRVYRYRRSASTRTDDGFVTSAAERLSYNFPNPFHPFTTIEYEVSEPGRVRIVIHDMLGRQIKTLVDSRQGAGSHRIMWDGTDASNRSAPPGVYLYQLAIGARTEVNRVVLLGD